MNRWVRRAAAAVAIAVAVWLVLTYYYLGPWLPGVVALALAVGAILGLARDAAPAHDLDLWPIAGPVDEPATATFTDARSRRLRQLCAQAQAGLRGSNADELRRILHTLAPDEPLPDRIDLTTIEPIIRRLESR